jgi:excinuclease ABC subunit B
MDPEVVVRPLRGQVDDLLAEVRVRAEAGQRTLVTTLTKKSAEDLTLFLKQAGVKATYLHSDVDTLDRVRVIRDLRAGVHDVLVGVNLLREGLDLPEVSQVAILDADKEGFLRSQVSLLQTAGRAARNVEGRVVLYADVETDSIRRMVEETRRRRALQEEYNRAHGITPATVKKAIREILSTVYEADYYTVPLAGEEPDGFLPPEVIPRRIMEMEREMLRLAREYRYEEAASLRDRIHAYRERMKSS